MGNFGKKNMTPDSGANWSLMPLGQIAALAEFFLLLVSDTLR